VTLAIADQVVDEQNRYEENCDLEDIEAQSHIFDAHGPSDDNEEGNQEQRDLHAGADCHPNGQVHLVLDGDCYGRGVLGSVADDGQQD
jgi:hypothetical protein